MNEATYNAAPGIRSTLLKVLDGSSPKHYRHALDNPDDGDTSDRKMRRGMHCALYEPKRFATDYAVYSDSKSRSGGKWDLWQATHPGVCGLLPNHHARCLALAAAVRADRVAGPLIRASSYFEHSITWTDEATGLLCKARLDSALVSPSRVIIPDLKTGPTTAPEYIERSFLRLKWGIQAAHYTAAARHEWPGRDVLFAIILAEDKAPHDVAVWYVSPEYMEVSEKKRRGLLNTIAECEASGVWPGRYQSAQTLDLPHWMEPEITIGEEV